MKQKLDSVEVFQQGLDFHRQGSLDLAKERYEEILQQNPRHEDALHLLGVCHFQKANFLYALQLIKKSLEYNPQQIAPHSNLGLVFLALNEPDQALVCFKNAINLKPDYADAWYNAGNALRHLNRLAEAIESYDRALSLQPGFVGALYNRGLTFKDLQQLEDARLSFDLVLSFDPQHIDALNNRGNTLRMLKRTDDAVRDYSQALVLNPQLADVLNNRGVALHELGQSAEAIADYQEAIRLKPDSADYLNNLGVALHVLGQFDEAETAYRKAIRLTPHKTEYYRNLVENKRLTKDDPCYLAMQEQALVVDSLPQTSQIYLHFAMGDALQSFGQEEQAFDHYLQGNALHRASIFYNEEATLGFLDAMRKLFTAEVVARKITGADLTDSPVFIVGMPRSGSTLIEQILASHPKACGIGESTAFKKALQLVSPSQLIDQDDVAALISSENSQLADLGRNYHQLARKFAGADHNSARIVDKNLFNFLYVGLIHLALPNARIIHSRRSPVETCLSCFSKLFGDDLSFAYELGEMGRYYAAYDKLMQHWRDVLPPGVMLDVQYENLVTDFDVQVARLLDHCGLEWDDACVAFHQNKRAVATASAAQVRKPLYQSSVERWRPSAALLAPLVTGFGNNLSSGKAS